MKSGVGRVTAIFAGIGACVLSVAPAEAAEADDMAFFETRIRPLLIERCIECHGEKKQKGGLRLDSQPGWRAGGDGGEVIVPGDPRASRLIEAVGYANEDLQMPPKKQLGPEEVASLTEWVRRGAPDPRVAAPTATKMAPMTLEQARAHWAFQPVSRPQIPDVPRELLGHNAIDRFVRARLITDGLKPNPPADARTLLRRAYFTLIGLPPSFERMEQFATDPSPAAFAALVDHLLARPEYGQRWGRHWLDVARYSDTTDKSTDAERRIPFAHTYRDYVIEALNTDRPFDRFVREQIAADRLPADAKPDLRALGFLTVGRRFEGNAEASELIIDDRIDVIGRGLLGLTLACARCHDHKFDAVPTADYYSLYGILASSREPMDLPETATPAASAALEKYRAERASIFADYDKHVDACVTKAKRLLLELAPEYLRHVVGVSPNHRTVQGFVPLDTPRGLLVRGGAPRWNALISESLRRGDPFFLLWSELIALPRVDFCVKAGAVLAEAAKHPERHDARVLEALRAKTPDSMLDVADVFGRLVSEALQSTEATALAVLIRDPASPLQFSREEIREELMLFITEFQLVSRTDGDAAAKIREKLAVLEAGAPVERAPVISVFGAPVQPHVMVRGDRRKPGPEVARRIPQVLTDVDGREYSDDGRLQLAQAIASAKNPLTARVIVNRVWQQHFGHGLVDTPDNFGAMGERPSHPELLDHLAGWFIEHGWSLKALHRYLLTSATWQQSSEGQTVAFERDPGNRLLWRMTPRRLEFEPMRDSLLRVAGRLDIQLGGRSAALDENNVRRAVYGYTDRFRIPALLRNFDVANPDQSISRRSETTHPLQALYFLNSPFVRAQAEAVNRQPEIAELLETPERIRAIYRRILARRPDGEELTLALRHLGESPTESRWVQFAHGLLLSNEFVTCD